jgi:hypothetical protein
MSTTPVHVGQLQKANGGAQSALIAQSQLPAPTSETAASVLAAQAKALVEARYLMAMHRPRDIEVARQKILQECKRPGFARAARYQKPIGKDRKKWPTGPSIRFAEAAIRCMTNIVVETMAIYDDREQRIVRVSVTDLEANVPYSQDVTVRKAVERRSPREGDVILRKRKNSYGDDVFLIEATDDEILNYQNALISKALRTLGLRLIPGDIIDEAMARCVQIQNDEDAKDPNAAKRAIIDSFGEQGVTADQLRDYLGHDLANLQPKELQDLRALYAALRDGETTWREIMDNRTPGEPEADTRTPAKEPDKQPEGDAKPPLEQFQHGQSAQPQQTAETTGSNEQPAADTEGKPTVEEIIKAINAANTAQQLDNVIANIGEVPQADKHDLLRGMAETKKKRLADRDKAPAGLTSAHDRKQRRTID